MSPSAQPRSGIRARCAWLGMTIVGISAFVGPATAMAAPSTTVPPRPSNSFATGKIASLVGATLEVQGTTGQTTVTVTPTTTFTLIEDESVSAIAVGDCVRASGTGSTAKGIKATTVSVSPATSSTCTFGFVGGTAGFGAGFGTGGAGGFRGGFGGGTGTRPSIPTSRRPTDFATASGPVTVVKGTTLTVKARIPKTVTSKKKTTSKKPQFVTKSVKVTLGSSATVTTTTSATSAQLATGICVTAIGPASTTGAVTATSVTISQPVNGACTAGFGGGGGFGRFGGGGGTRGA
jgi:hypothetical protein